MGFLAAGYCFTGAAASLSAKFAAFGMLRSIHSRSARSIARSKCSAFWRCSSVCADFFQIRVVCLRVRASMSMCVGGVQCAPSAHSQGKMLAFYAKCAFLATMPAFHFPVTLANLLERRGFSQRELARRADLSPSNVTQILDGQRCTPEALAACCRAAAETESDRYALLCAHLRDEIVRADADPTHVVIRHVEGADLDSLDLTPEMNAYIGTLARAAESDQDVAAVLEGLAGVLVHKTAAEQDLKRYAEVYPFPGDLAHQVEHPEQPSPEMKAMVQTAAAAVQGGSLSGSKAAASRSSR